MNAVTVPLDKLIELQKKAALVDDLVEALEMIIDRWDHPEKAEVPANVIKEHAKMVVVKVKVNR